MYDVKISILEGTACYVRHLLASAASAFGLGFFCPSGKKTDFSVVVAHFSSNLNYFENSLLTLETLKIPIEQMSILFEKNLKSSL